MNATGTKFNVRRLTALGMLTALAALVMLIRIPIFPSADFLKLDFKDIIIAIGGFIYGPLAAFMMSLVVGLIEMVTVSESGPIGLVMNVLASASLTVTASFIYARRRTMKSAVAGLLAGGALMVAVMLLWNYFIIPLYAGIPREVMPGMLLFPILPFNLFKVALNISLIMLIYKPVTTALRKAKLIPQEGGALPEQSSKNLRIGITMLSALVLVSCVLLFLVFQGVL